MTSVQELNAVGQVMEGIFTQAWEAFREGDLQQAIDIAHRMIMEPRLGDLHKAGFHLILAYSDDEYQYHAQRAVELIQTLYTDPDRPPTEEQKRIKAQFLAIAQGVEKEAGKDVDLEEKLEANDQDQEVQAAEIPKTEAIELTFSGFEEPVAESKQQEQQTTQAVEEEEVYRGPVFKSGVSLTQDYGDDEMLLTDGSDDDDSDDGMKDSSDAGKVEQKDEVKATEPVLPTPAATSDAVGPSSDAYP